NDITGAQISPAAPNTAPPQNAPQNGLAQTFKDNKGHLYARYLVYQSDETLPNGDVVRNKFDKDLVIGDLPLKYQAYPPTQAQKFMNPTNKPTQVPTTGRYYQAPAPKLSVELPSVGQVFEPTGDQGAFAKASTQGNRDSGFCWIASTRDFPSGAT